MSLPFLFSCLLMAVVIVVASFVVGLAAAAPAPNSAVDHHRHRSSFRFSERSPFIVERSPMNSDHVGNLPPHRLHTATRRDPVLSEPTTDFPSPSDDGESKPPPTVAGPYSTMSIFQTAQNTTDRWAFKGDLPLHPVLDAAGGPSAEPSTIQLHVNTGTRRQQFIGFGGAFTDSASYVFNELDFAVQERVLNSYFSEDGLRYRLGRLTIGSCDFSYSMYNYDNVSGDFNLTHFDIAHDRANIIPFVRRALAKRQPANDLLLVASPWSPPGWMKSNGDMICRDDCRNCSLRDEARGSWAAYLSRYLSAYEVALDGLPIWALTVQNEPEYCPTWYEGLGMTAEAERDFVKGFLGPRLEADHPSTRILIFDCNKYDLVPWATTVLSDPAAARFIAGTAVHWYTGDQFDNLNTTHWRFPDKMLLATEATVGRATDPAQPLWENGEHYAHDIMGDFNNWVTGFIDWNLMLDSVGGPLHVDPDHCENPKDLCGSDSMLLADVQTQTVYPQVFYWYVGHFSRFIDPGAQWVQNTLSGTVRVVREPRLLPRHTSPSDRNRDRGGRVRSLYTSVESTVFVNPNGDLIVVVMNPTDDAQKVALVLELEKLGTTVELPAHSIQTWRLRPAH